MLSEILKSLIFLLLLSNEIRAFETIQAEVDSFTFRYEGLKDSSEIINKKTNEYIQAALLQTNKAGKTCSKKKLYKNLRKYFHNHIQGEFSHFVDDSPLIDKITLSTRDSIYGDFKWYDSPVLGLFVNFVESAAKLIRVGDIYFGSDKFEHMFGMGFYYYKNHYLKQKPLKKVMKYGEFTERYYLGAMSTGVFAYADLMANFTGMRFWNHFLGEYPDILGQEHGPYVTCENNKWVQAEKIDWKNYINIGFDEANNCSKFKNKRLLNIIKKRQFYLSQETKINLRHFTCPINPRAIYELKKSYNFLPLQLINIWEISVL